MRLIFANLSHEERQQLYAELDLSEEEFHKMYIAGYEEDLMQDGWYRCSRLLLVYVPPILLVVGIVGNILSFVVLVRRSMRHVSTYNYLAALSVADTLVLLIGLLRLWIGQMSGFDLKDSSNVACKLINVVNYTVSDYSVWLLVAVTVERYIVTAHALQANHMCTTSRARRVMLALLAAIFLINAHMFYTVEARQNKTIICGSRKNFEVLINGVLPWLDAALYSIVPSIVMIALNVAIIRQVLRSIRHRRQMAAVSRSSTTLALRGNGATSSALGGVDSGWRITVMLLIISFVFVATTLPMMITMIVFAMAPASKLEHMGVYRFARAVGELMMYFNHSVNFYLYLLTGNKFRQQLAALFRRRRPTTYVDVDTQETEMNGLLLRLRSKR